MCSTLNGLLVSHIPDDIDHSKNNKNKNENNKSYMEEEDEDSVTTILSGESEHSADSAVSSSKRTSDFKWFNVLNMFSHRDRMMEHMSKTKSTAFMNVLRRREMLVRRQRKEGLVSPLLSLPTCGVVGDDERGVETSHASVTASQGGDECCAADHDAVVWYDAAAEIQDQHLTCSTPDNTVPCYHRFLHRIYDAAMFEWHTTVPALYSFTFYCIFHSSLYDVVELSSQQVAKYVNALDLTWLDGQVMSLLLVLAFGIFLLWSSGYLYWWLNDSDYRCIKFDYHNRLRLQHWDAKYLLWVKRHPTVQAVMFFLGYHFCYNCIYQVYAQLCALALDHVKSMHHQMAAVTTTTTLGSETIQQAACNLDDSSAFNFTFGQSWPHEQAPESCMAATVQLAEDNSGGDQEFDQMQLSMIVFFLLIGSASTLILQMYGFRLFAKY